MSIYDKTVVDELRTRGYEDKDIAKRMAYGREHIYSRELNHWQYADLLEELKECEVCGELGNPDNEDDMIDTDGLVNGGYGYAHLSCYREGV